MSESRVTLVANRPAVRPRATRQAAREADAGYAVMVILLTLASTGVAIFDLLLLASGV